ncbi:MAG: hypothetical protein A2487_14510 [Candidatus Raymondbacteria bacterium RifOxyC12_full_50_8]|uniref:HTH araC/xylS-type domain-containing protein n=1 Tax=Candidatus Raymondbacteria bacterium RIFOXYD12_FULL_49_13 TaxID=1817890 RepID=A0A1F7F6E5_UNCRA|nr:MAG: hypothetical protein A2248_03460 [Candidatus Raymondbacteria bacterium RIFOXYA2_FULL_49_16]OGJ99657.1 MAG: hypothetical protein A2350_16115 [Candidatus Raymondbacteria bacterium RifOxyB12_full_50_8]OGK02148.1 MAG: hypothetical protein A2519_18875 [Candidatus Raymondbacteria bacterium RIFOXYD12_FULL_49_13]OGK06874.1 MAG: hypothetical protein A2487_14510 [Candidatus Raymondbacteria bacterium RifOxyC12_full_50_8]OGP42535.1 MAG: hypothetical protein A2324_17495 [Candidatus Raymondbacteria b
MSKPSNWPITEKAIRFIMPAATVAALVKHPLSSDLFPHAVGYYPSAHGHVMNRAVHDDWLFLYCVQGKATVAADGREYSVSKGDLVFLPNGLPHSYRASEKEPWTIYWVHFTGKKAANYVAHLSRLAHGPVLPIGLRQKLVADFIELVDIAAKNTDNNLHKFIYAANLLKQMICYLSLIKPRADSTSDTPFNLEQVHALMQQEIEGSINLDTLAAGCGMSKFYFAKRYKQVTGTSPIAHFINIKMARACRLIDIGDKSITETAYALGYLDTYYFSRIFKKVIGISPRQYRNLNKG